MSSEEDVDGLTGGTSELRGELKIVLPCIVAIPVEEDGSLEALCSHLDDLVGGWLVPLLCNLQHLVVLAEIHELLLLVYQVLMEMSLVILVVFLTLANDGREGPVETVPVPIHVHQSGALDLYLFPVENWLSEFLDSLPRDDTFF